MFKLFRDNIRNYFLANSGIERHIVLAEFPKCGGTYLHSILNTLISYENKNFNYSNISTFSKGMDLDMIKPNRYRNVINSYTQKQLLIKTHQHYSKCFHKVICLYRDPIEVFKSFYNMRKSYLNNKLTFSRFIRGKSGVKSYIKFYQTYLNTPQKVRIMFVDYKDVISKTETIKDILYFIFGILIDEKEIEKIIKANNKQIAIEEEAIYAKYDMRRKLYPQIKFTNNKRYNYEIDIEEINFITEETREICNLLGMNNS